MGDVVQFPTEDVKLEQLKQQIEKGVTDLEFKYNELDALHEMLSNREAEANELESSFDLLIKEYICLLYTSPSPRDPKTSRMPSSA